MDSHERRSRELVETNIRDHLRFQRQIEGDQLQQQRARHSHNQTVVVDRGRPSWFKRAALVGVTALGCQMAYNFGDFNDTPGQFFDTSAFPGNIVHIVDAPVADIEFAASHIAAVAKMAESSIAATAGVVGKIIP